MERLRSIQNSKKIKMWRGTMKQTELREKFEAVFGRDGDIGVYFAPGRVNLIREHTDNNVGHVIH